MARSPRLVVPGVPVHLIQRGNNRTATFRSADDFERYRETLYHASRRYRCAIHAYVLMTNHIHLLITPEDDSGLAYVVQTIGRRYVRWMNARYDRTGTLWEGRFRSSVIDSEQYLFACSRYIELNPVRAQMVDRPDRYHWSSHRHNAHGEQDELIAPHALYRTLGSSPPEREAAYRALFRSQLEPRTLDSIRRATHRGSVLGDRPFCERIQAIVERPPNRSPHGANGHSAAFQRL
jgi:putative transposase